MNKDIWNKIHVLSAKEDIRTLAMRYARAIDATDSSNLCALWIPERTAILPWIDLGVIEDVIIPSWKTRGRSQIRVLNHEIVVDDEYARGVVSSDVVIELPRYVAYQSVRYFDSYKIDDNGHWRFLKRYHDLLYGCRLETNPWDQSPANWPTRQVGSGDSAIDAQAFLSTGCFSTKINNGSANDTTS